MLSALMLLLTVASVLSCPIRAKFVAINWIVNKMQAFLKTGKSSVNNNATDKQANAPVERRKPPAPWVEK